jgi:hypothetical protein
MNMRYFVVKVPVVEGTSLCGEPLPDHEFEVRRRFLLWSYVVDRDFSEEEANALAARLNGT